MLALVGSTAIRHVESHHTTRAALVAKNAIIAKISIMPVMVSFISEIGRCGFPAVAATRLLDEA